MYRFTADTHFNHTPNKHGHGGILFHANRPFKNIEEHDEYLINAWNKDATSKTITYILGDFAWRNHNHYINALKGKKILITGSHDKMSLDVAKNFTEVHENMLIRNFGARRIVMTHCAMLVWEGSVYGSINLHGHSHGRLMEYTAVKRLDVGVDVAPNFAPWPLELILYKMSLKEKKLNLSDCYELTERVINLRKTNNNLMQQWKTGESKCV